MTTNSALHDLSIQAAAHMLSTHQVSSVELLEHHLHRIAQLDPELGAFTRVFTDTARAQAIALDKERAAGKVRGPLHGIPLGVKDLFAVANTPHTAGSAAYLDRIAPADAVVVRRLRDAGAVLVGAHTMSEGAFAEHHPYWGAPVSPWNPRLWTGTSSSGSAVATITGMGFAALGSDTGGSIRFPSSASGLSGLKASSGGLPLTGVTDFAVSLDSLGVLARSAYDCAVVYDSISGPHPTDARSMRFRPPVATLACNSATDLRGHTRIGFDHEFVRHTDSRTQQMLDSAIEVLQGVGIETVPVTLPSVDTVVADWFDTCAVEAQQAHREATPSQRALLGDELTRLIDHGSRISAHQYARILGDRRRFANELSQAMADVDALLLPVTAESSMTNERVAQLGFTQDWQNIIMRATSPFNAAGLPAMTVPGDDPAHGGPLGFQLVGHVGGEGTVVAIAHLFQQATNFHAHRPPSRPALTQ